jgi:hypothetical protein
MNESDDPSAALKHLQCSRVVDLMLFHPCARKNAQGWGTELSHFILENALIHLAPANLKQPVWHFSPATRHFLR